MSDKTTLGEFLRNEREMRGITIEQVASATKVGVRTLHALEGDHYSELPAKPYIRGFVTSYCRFIGLDPKEIRTRFEDYITQKTGERPNREGGHSGYVFEKKDGEQQSRTVLLIAICSFIGVGGVAVIFLKPSLRHHRTSHIDRLREAQSTDKLIPIVNLSPLPGPAATGLSEALAPPPGASPTPSPSTVVVAGIQETDTADTQNSTNSPDPSPSKAPQNLADPLDSGLGLHGADLHHKVLCKVMADIWVRYKVDERPVRKFIVRKGKVLVLRAKDTIALQISNPNSITLSYNGRGQSGASAARNAGRVHGIPTFIFPSTEQEKGRKIFEDDSPLPKTPDPISDTNSQTQEH